MTRPDGREPNALRPVTLTRGWQQHAEGSVLVEFGLTRVLCSASATEGVPRWRRGSGLGWVTAEYAMLPRATHTRNDRESVKGRVGGRTHEISRLVGRALRAAVDLKALGENTIVIDCDVLVADGGTRTAAITGAYVALADAAAHLGVPAAVATSVSAVSVGIIDGEPRLDLCYAEDVRAETDMNVVATGTGDLIEVQGTAEGAPFSRRELDALLDLAIAGCADLAAAQRTALAGPPPHPDPARLMRLLLASRNDGKVTELAAIIPADIELVGLSSLPGYQEPPETGLSFAENALIKARAGAAASGLPTIADDSGLTVDVLNGMPGIFSARWAGRHGDDEANLDLVLAQISDVPDEHRGAAFVCAAALVHPDGTERTVEARWPGRLLRARAGTNGFGYDPIFVPTGETRTSAELDPAEKNAVSHRGQAFRRLFADTTRS